MTEPRRIDLSLTEIIDAASLSKATTVTDPEQLSEGDRLAVAQFVNTFQPHPLTGHLPVPGMLEHWPIVAVALASRFCDFPDPVHLGDLSFPTSFAIAAGRRRPANMTYTVELSDEEPAIRTAAEQCFGVWSFAAPALAPQRRPSGPADLTIGTGTLEGSTLGSTKRDGSRITLRPRLSDNPQFRHVLLHEIGHALGLLHSTNPNAVMYPITSTGDITLVDDDVSAIRAEYGWSPQRAIPGRGTDRGPALCPFLGRLVMTWKGIGDDHNIWFATSDDGVSWSDQRVVPSAATSDQPALATGTDGRLIMAFKGIPGDSGLYWTIFDGNNWGPVMNINGRGSSNAPTLGWQASTAPDSDVLYMAWKGMNDDTGLYFAHLDRNSWNWSDQQHIGGVGSADGPALRTDVDGTLRMIWRGMPGDTTLYNSVLHGIFWEPQQLVEWIVPGNDSTGTSRVDQARSEYGPAATTRFAHTFFAGQATPTPNKLFLAWRGSGADQGLYFTQRAVDQADSGPVTRWSSQVDVPRVGSSHRPAAALFNDFLHLAWKGIDDDHTIYMTTLAP